MFVGAVDCIVVSVVVIERTDGAGDEKVLPSPPPRPLELTARPAVAVVSVFECAVSELIVSGLVASVGAADLLLADGSCWPSCEVRNDTLLSVVESQLTLIPDGGV